MRSIVGGITVKILALYRWLRDSFTETSTVVRGMEYRGSRDETTVVRGMEYRGPRDEISVPTVVRGMVFESKSL